MLIFFKEHHKIIEYFQLYTDTDNVPLAISGELNFSAFKVVLKFTVDESYLAKI